ncbi:MAG: acyl-CoA desaturase [Phycisphaerales bacterium]
MHNPLSDLIHDVAAAHAHAIEPRLPLKLRLLNLAAILLPFLGVGAAIYMLWPFGFGWTSLGLLIGMYIVTGLGVTIGYHRLFTHKSFETGPVMKTIIGIAGSMAVEGPIIGWVADHRRHHQHSDHEGDPHSPHVHDGGAWNILKGAIHAHMGWLLARGAKTDVARYAPDLERDAIVVWLSKTFPIWVLVSLAIPTILGGIITMTWTGALLGLAWGGLVRIFLVHHITWSINSVCHIWGTRAFECGDESRNNVVCGVLGFGEGWHNNHHAFPTSARHGLRWWQIDTSYWLIRGMEAIGLVRRVKVPTPERIESKRRKRGAT